VCVTMPGQVVEVDAQGATVDLEGHRRHASTVLVPDVVVGEWVFVAMGTIIERLPAELAGEMRRLVREASGLTELDPSARGGPGGGRP